MTAAIRNASICKIVIRAHLEAMLAELLAEQAVAAAKQSSKVTA